MLHSVLLSHITKVHRERKKERIHWKQRSWKTETFRTPFFLGITSRKSGLQLKLVCNLLKTVVGTWHKYFPIIITFIWPFFDNYNFSLEKFWGFSAIVAPSSLFLMKYLKHSKTIQIIRHSDLTNVSILPHCSLPAPYPMLQLFSNQTTENGETKVSGRKWFWELVTWLTLW